MQFVDAHCHLHFKRIGRVVPLVLDEARRNGIKHFVVNATSTRDVDDVLHMAQQHRDVTACFGIHPYSIDVSTVDADLESLFAFLSAVKVPFCFGEFGMDKTFTGRAGKVTALDGSDLDIRRGEIFGIIGLSGAGKSTLVRCINFLE